MASAEEWVTIAQLGSPRGNKGELVAYSLSDSPGRFEKLSRIFLFGKGEEYRVEHVWWHDGNLILKFAGIDSITAAEALSHAEVRVPFAERAPLEPGAFYQSDLIGCDLVAWNSGVRLGRVTGCDDATGQTLLEIDADWLVPFAPAICKEVDLEKRRIAAELPEGLKDLNRS